MTANASMNDLDGGTSRATGGAGAHGRGRAAKSSYGPPSAPPGLLSFVRGLSARAAAAGLGLSVGTIYRLQQGYWPNDPRWIMQAWEQHQARRGVISSSWFLRRVRPGGTVRHAGRDYTAVQLSARTGQLLAIAREAGGGLVAQTLELPAERLSLTVAEESPQ